MKLPRRKYVYVMSIWSKTGLPTWKAKPGISYDADLRAAAVEQSIWQVTGEKVTVRPFLKLKVWMWASIETVILSMWGRLRSRRYQGASGWSEVVHVLNPISCIIAGAVWCGAGLDCPGWFALCVLLLPWPIDLALCLLLLWLIEMAAICLAAYAALLGASALLSL